MAEFKVAPLDIKDTGTIKEIKKGIITHEAKP